MTTSTPRSASFTLQALLFFGSMISSAWAQATITGTITNSATGKTLTGATVAIAGAGHETVTDEFGVYRLSNVPVGNIVLTVSYTGLDITAVPLELAAGTVMRRDIGLTSKIYEMSQFVVTGEREGNAQAVTLQRQSSGIKNVVSMDIFGNVAGNPGDLLTRMPGVAGESVGGDIRFIRIRGLHHNLNTITMDGNRMADAASAGATREYQFQQIGSDAIERIEVTKSPTPDMDADSIGGAVNMVTKSAFDRSPERRISGSFGAIWRPFDERDDPIPNFSASYSEVFGDKWGVALNFGHRATRSLIDITNQAHQAVPNGVAGPAYTYQFMIGDTRNKRTRWGGGLRLEYKLSPSSRFFVNGTSNKHTEHANITSGTWSTAQTVATRDAQGNLTGTGAIIPGYTEDMTEWRPVNQSIVTAAADSTNKRGASMHLQAGAVHRFERLQLDYDAFRSKSKTHYPGNKSFDIIARGIGMRIERGEDRYEPAITQTAGPDATQIGSYTENIYNIARSAGWDEYRGATLSARLNFTSPVPSYLKAGLRFREQARVLEDRPYRTRYVGPDGVMGVNPATGMNDDDLAQFGNPNVENVIFDGRYPKLPYSAFPGRDNAGSAYNYSGFNIDTALRTTPHLFREEIAFVEMSRLVGDQGFKETISAAYLMGNVTLGRLDVMGGRTG